MSETIKDRILEVIDFIDLSFPQLERRTGIKAMTWRNLKNTETRANEEHINAICVLCPEFAYWIATGKEQPNAGNINPRTKKVQLNLKEA